MIPGSVPAGSCSDAFGPIVLIPSIVIESCEQFPPATEMLPLASVCTPGCVVNVEIGLVDPATASGDRDW